MTLAGARHAARVGVSLLARAGLAEMIADSEEAFITAAAALAEDEAKRRELRFGMRDRLEASLLRDENAFADSFSTALEELWGVG
jgi:predicted O-linked N-acetylglucosamine transferase (SPINDLY family)